MLRSAYTPQALREIAARMDHDADRCEAEAREQLGRASELRARAADIRDIADQQRIGHDGEQNDTVVACAHCGRSIAVDLAGEYAHTDTGRRPCTDAIDSPMAAPPSTTPSTASPEPTVMPQEAPR